MRYLLHGADEDFTSTFADGDLVTITNGEFRGLQGVVVRVNKQTLSLRLESLQLDFVVQVPARLVISD